MAPWRRGWAVSPSAYPGSACFIFLRGYWCHSLYLIAKCSGVLPWFGNRVSSPAVLARGFNFRSLLSDFDQTFALLSKEASHPFLYPQIYLQNRHTTRMQKPQATWFGLRTGCHYSIYTAWRTSRAFSLAACWFLGVGEHTFLGWGWNQVTPVTGNWKPVTLHLALTPFWKRALSLSCTLVPGIPNESVAQQLHFLTDFPRWAWVFERVLVGETARCNHGSFWMTELWFFYCLEVVSVCIFLRSNTTSSLGLSLHVIPPESLPWSWRTKLGAYPECSCRSF